MILKRGEIFAFVFVVLLLAMPLASAQFSGGYFYNAQLTVGPVLESAIGILAPIFQFAVGDYSNSETFIMKVLLLILLIAIIGSILRAIPRFEEMNDATLNIVTVIISVIAIRFLATSNLVEGILLPYGTLGAAILMILPFILWFWFIHQSRMGPGMRKFAWGFFMIIFFVFWTTRAPIMGKLANQIYGWAMVVMIFVLIFDRSIHRYFKTEEANKAMDDHIRDKLTVKKNLYRQAAENNDIQEMRRIEREIRRLAKHL